MEAGEPHTTLDKHYISHALWSLPGRTVPCLLKVVGGKMVAESVHSELYEAVSGVRTAQELLDVIEEKMDKLRKLETVIPERVR